MQTAIINYIYIFKKNALLKNEKCIDEQIDYSRKNEIKMIINNSLSIIVVFNMNRFFLNKH